MKEKKKNIVVIPARGGSKRLPNKNVRLLDGVPLIVRSITYAKLYSDFIDEIFVSTEDAEIKRIAIEEGVKVIDRPPELATDTSTTVSVLQHALTRVQDVENVILLQPTNPLRPRNLFPLAWEKYSRGSFDSLMTVSKLVEKLGKIQDEKFVPFNYTLGERSQDLEPFYRENGLLYISKASLISQGRILGDEHLPLVVDHPFASVDIDDEDDLEYAEYLLSKNKKE